MLLSILFSARPDEVKLLLIDPKMLEFQSYDGIPHLLRPVITDPKSAARGLGWVVQEMERRYKLLAEAGVRSIEAYNLRISQVQGAVVGCVAIRQSGADGTDDSFLKKSGFHREKMPNQRVTMGRLLRSSRLRRNRYPISWL